ncbi:uncharacterized protein LOC143469640 [Clavelina lepadiformis]|uniref:uncharacterized protein LOC143469640 n=1 Tax=Clavelina lepadiformis TaxID=159417 RepID=UPI0040415514
MPLFLLFSLISRKQLVSFIPLYKLRRSSVEIYDKNFLSTSEMAATSTLKAQQILSQRDQKKTHKAMTKNLKCSVCKLIIVILCTTYQVSEGRVRTRNASLPGIQPIRSCGSRLVDALRFMCRLGMSNHKMCMQSTVQYCHSNAYMANPICRFNCTQTKKDRMQHNTSDDVFLERWLRNHVITAMTEGRLRRTHNKSKNGPTTRLLGRAKDRVVKRSMAMKCCRNTCSIDVLEEFCSRLNQ